MCRVGPGTGQEGRPEASRCLGVALGACDLEPPSVAQTWEDGDRWQCENFHCISLGQRQMLQRDRDMRVWEEESQLYETGG